MPTTEAEAEAANTALRTLLATIPWFYYDDSRILIINQANDPTPEMSFLIDTYFYRQDIIPTTNSLRAALNTALLGDPDIVSIGDINIDDTIPCDMFFHQWPEIEHIDSRNGIVRFQDKVPAAAQIEICKYTRWKPDTHDGPMGPYPIPHLGKRFRPFLLLGVGDLQVDLLPWNFNNRYRDNFTARYIWREPPGRVAPAKGIVGPTAPYSFSTTNRWEIAIGGIYLIMEAAPSSFGN